MRQAIANKIDPTMASDSRLAPVVSRTPSEVIQYINKEEIRKFKLGLFFLAIAVSLWIFGLELLNAVLKGDEYQKPWMFAYVTGSCFTLNLIPDLFGRRRTGPRPESELSHRETTALAAIIAIIYYLYNMFVMLALQYTLASNQTVLSSTTSIFTLFIGILLGIETFSLQKLACIVISFAGVMLINWSESGLSNNSGNKFVPKNPRLGNALSVFGALMYALYMIVMRVRSGGSRTVNERRVFGLVGLLTLVAGIPFLFLVHIFEIERFELPPNKTVLAMILVNGVFSVISDYTTILAMLLTSPLVTSLSLLSSIPITIFIDKIILWITDAPQQKSDHVVYYFGIGSILVSILLINVNLSTENELIVEVIDEALEEAIREDEVLSPYLSPLLSPQLQTAADRIRKSPRIQLGIRSPLVKKSPLSQLPLTASNVPGLDLNEETGEAEDGSDAMHLTVSGGRNHKYTVRVVPDREGEDSSRGRETTPLLR